jgi:phage terminase large subunit GpA-like protein
MNSKNIVATIGLWLIFVAAMAQQPAVLVKGKADSQECKEWVETRLEQMTLKEKIGQLFIHTAPLQDNEATHKNLRNAVKEYKVGGLLFSGGALATQAKLTNMAQEMAAMADAHEELNEYVESIDDDLADLEEVLFDEEDECGCCDCDDEDCDCCDCCCDEDDDLIAYACPHCGHEIEFSASDVDFDEDFLCPACDKPIFPELNDEE